MTQPIKSPDDFVCVKITDFGLARMHQSRDEMMTSKTGTYVSPFTSALDGSRSSQQ